jgi:hypothetical protein
MFMRLQEFEKSYHQTLRENIERDNDTEFNTCDLMLIIESHANNRWSAPQNYEGILAEAFDRPSVAVDTNQVVFRRADPLYFETKAKLIDRNESLRNGLHKFMHQKRSNPLAHINPSDRMFSPQGFFSKLVPGLRHVHMPGGDISLVYRVEGNVVYLYGFFSHKDLGTAMPANIRTQQNMAVRLKNSTFK